MGYIFSLFPPFLDSVVIYIDKFLLSKHNINSTALTIYSGFFAGASGLVILCFTGFHPIVFQTAVIISIAGFFGVLYLLAYFKALTLDEASRVGSLFQLTPVMVLILSFVFLGETLLLKQYIGSFLIIIAGFLFSIKKIDSGVFKINKAFWYMVISCFLAAFIYILFKLGVKEVSFWHAIPYESLGNTIAAICILFYGNNYKMVKKELKGIPKNIFLYLLISELIYRCSRFSLYFAILLIPASLVSVLQGFQPIFLLIIGVILSLWFPKVLKEVISKEALGIKIVSIILIFIGLYLIFL